MACFLHYMAKYSISAELFNGEKMIAIKTEKLCKSYGDLKAVDNISFELNKGEIFGFFGPNGSGKTTTVRLLNGMLKASSGEAMVMGLNPAAEENRFRTATMSENALMYEKMSVLDNLYFFGNLYLVPQSKLKSKIEGLLKEFNLWDKRNAKLGSFSTGMKKQVYLARTLLHDPELIFLDEPTSGLDPENAGTVTELVRELAEQRGVTIFLCSHNLAAAGKICDAVGIIKNGKLLACGKKDKVIEQTKIKTSVTITTNNDKTIFDDPCLINEKLKALIAGGEKILNLSIKKPDIEDAYFYFINGRAKDENADNLGNN